MGKCGRSVGGQQLTRLPDISEIPRVPAPAINYPMMELWQARVPADEKLQVVNENDFPLLRVWENLGLSNSPLKDSFGSTDYSELVARRDLIHLLYHDPEFRGWLIKITPPIDMPVKEGDFLNFYESGEPHNPYWSVVHEFRNRRRRAEARTGTVSERLDHFCSVLDSDGSLALEGAETAMAGIVAEGVKHLAAIGGFCHFTIIKTGGKLSISLDKTEASGYLRFAASLSDWSNRDGRFRRLRQLLSWRKRRRAMREVTLGEIPPEIWTDLHEWLNEQFEKLNRRLRDPDPQIMGSLAANMAARHGFPLIDWVDGARGGLVFCYDQDGLRAQMCKLEPRERQVGRLDLLEAVANHAGYNSGQRRAMKRAEELIAHHFRLARNDRERGIFLDLINRADPLFFKSSPIVAPNTDSVCRWYAIGNLYGSYALKDVVEACLKHRTFFSAHLERLRQVASLVEGMLKKGSELDLPVCIAEPIEPEHHLIDFEGIVPVHLLDHLREKGERAVPISLPELNGQPVCVTGSHGGGKTTAGVSVLVALYLAQSLLLTFGTRFRFNPKKVIAALLLERQDNASTIEVYLQKLKKILQVARRTKPHEMVVVIDELGSATQESAGAALGRDVLRSLAARRASVLVSTQIQSLAEYAQDELGALTCHFDRQHKLHSGIGDGALAELSQGLGLNRLLKV